MKHITTSELIQMTIAEGLILQGCGGDPNEWLSGINETLTHEGILLDGDTFKDVYVFEHDGHTNILFSMTDVNLDIGKLAMWRLRTHGSFGGTWLSDFLINQLGITMDSIEQPKNPIITVTAYNKVLVDERDGVPDTDTITDFFFPATEEDIMARLAGIGVDGVRYKTIELDEGRITMPGSGKEAPLPRLGKSSIDELNYLAVKIRDLSANDLDLLAAALEAERRCNSVAEIINLTENLYCFDLQPAFSAKQYGDFLLETANDNNSEAISRLEASNDPGDRELASHIMELITYLDAEAYGQAAAEEEYGVFTECGYLTEEDTFKEVYCGPDDIPPKYRVFAYPEPELPTVVRDVDLAPFLMKLHAVRGGDMSDAEYNLGVLSTLHSNEYLFLMNGRLSFLTEAAHAYRQGSSAHDVWTDTEERPDTLAVAIHITETHGRLAGDVVLLDFAQQREEILGHTILPIHIDAVLQDGSEKTFAPEEWGALQQSDRDTVQSWTLRFDHEQTDALNRRLTGISCLHDEYYKPIGEDAFLVEVNAVYMAQSQYPQPDMLRVSHPDAREMLARGDAEVFRLTPDSPEQLSQLDAVRSGLWYSFNREFAIRRADIDGLNKWAGRVVGDIQRKNERGDPKKSHETEI